jgi:hypothetical protein
MGDNCRSFIEITRRLSVTLPTLRQVVFISSVRGLFSLTIGFFNQPLKINSSFERD